MRRRIIHVIAGIASAAIILTVLAVFLCIGPEAHDALLSAVGGRLLLALLILIALSCVAATAAGAHIVRPLQDKNLDAYKELQPLYEHVEQQRRSLKAGADELEEKQMSLQTVMENMTEGLILLDADALIVSVNRSACAILAIEGDTLGKDIMAVYRDEQLQAAVFAALGGVSGEELLRTPCCSVQLVSNPIRVDGAVRGVMLLLIDVTEHVANEDMRREFSANVSHELKTPLTSISGYAEIMRDGIVRSEDMASFAGKIYDEAQRLIALIEDIIKLSRLDENASMEMQRVDLFGLCLDVTERLHEKARRHKVTLELEGESCAVFGNLRLLDEMIYNLTENAIKYNKADGSVKVHVAAHEGGVLLEVADTGIGIAREHQGRVFERFYRVDKSHSKETGGTGLGLSIVKHGALVHGATLELESVVGEGTTVRVLFGKIDN